MHSLNKVTEYYIFLDLSQVISSPLYLIYIISNCCVKATVDLHKHGNNTFKAIGI